MEKMSETARYYIERAEEMTGVPKYSEQDFKNWKNILEHWIRDRENSGRAHFGGISKDTEVPIEFIEQNAPAINELVNIRQKCKNCAVGSIAECPVDKTAKKRAREFEKEKGLDEGRVSPAKLAGYRPELIYRNKKFYTAYGECAVRSKQID